jgi:imidazolonepropionase-like amidohydrolase
LFGKLALAGLTLAASMGVAIAAPAGQAVTLYEGGPILTMVGDSPRYAEALAVRNGRILAVGDRSAVVKAAGKNARHVDLAGRTLLPGFIDSHGHVTSVGQAAGFASCLVSDFDGALFSSGWKDALWDRYITGAPPRQRRSVERYSIVKRA